MFYAVFMNVVVTRKLNVVNGGNFFGFCAKLTTIASVMKDCRCVCTVSSHVKYGCRFEADRLIYYPLKLLKKINLTLTDP